MAHQPAIPIPKWLREHVHRLHFNIRKTHHEIEPSVGIFSDISMTEHEPITHSTVWDAERPERLLHTLQELEDSGLMAHCKQLPFDIVTKKQLILAHTPSHVDSMLSMQYCADHEALKLLSSSYNSVYFNTKSIQCALISCSCVVSAVSACVKGEVTRAACVVRPPGHHAEANCCMGFCIFNNVAVAAKHAQSVLGVDRILIVDFDVHHGNGIQSIFADDPNVCYFSVHRWDNGAFYPGFIVDSVGVHAGSAAFVGGPSKVAQGRSVNVAWTGQAGSDYGAPAMGDGDYKAVWEQVLMPMAREFCPSLILVAAGFDAARGDHIGECDVTPEGYAYLIQELCTLQCPVVVALEGGYNVPSTKYGFGACVAALCGATLHVDSSKFPAPKVEALQAINATLQAQSSYWDFII